MSKGELIPRKLEAALGPAAFARGRAFNGDEVLVAMRPYDLSKGRTTYRFK
jgi:hypothetical protein